MSEEQARAVCAHLAATHEDRQTHRWIARVIEGGLDVVKVNIAPPSDDLRAEQRADPRPSPADDVLTPSGRNIGPYAGA